MDIKNEIKTLMNQIGTGEMNEIAYDTAWIARLIEYCPDMAQSALEWITENQLSDGSWGANGVLYYHDRVISTLSAMIALTYRGRRSYDRLQVRKGMEALERISSGATIGLASDPNGATVGFELICPTLVSEAERLGIIKQQGDRILGRMKRLREQKLAKLTGMKINRHITPAFSSEMAGEDGQSILDVENLQESNGSVGNSPAATAYFVAHVKKGDPEALRYICSIKKGGIPFAYPFDVFERAWVIWNLSLSNAFSHDEQVQNLLQVHLEFLKSGWKPGQGIGFSRTYTPCDADDTAITLEILNRYMGFNDELALQAFEGPNYFYCYPFESNPSISANIHVLCALKQLGYEASHPSVKKTLGFLRSTQRPEGFWNDKWHLSPYYSTAHMIIAASSYDHDLCEPAVNWIIRTQQSNGAWGAFNSPTAEETAYCIQALMFWYFQYGTISKECIYRALEWLRQNYEKPFPSLWIGKALYCPKFVVKSSILSAMVLGSEFL